MSGSGGNRFVGRKSGGSLLPAEDEDRLRWLDGDEEPEDGGLDTNRILALVGGAALLLAAVAGGLWWLLHTSADPEFVADGSLIEAPDGPYKVRPDDPGGRQLQGTGDVSFEVAEGRDHAGTIAGEAEDAEVEETGAIGVQVGAYPSREEATTAWSRMVTRVPSLQGRSHVIVEGSADSGTIFRLQAVAGSADDARALCQAIVSEGGDCQVKR